MKKLIDADAAIDHWRHIVDATSADNRYNTGFVDGLEFCISHLSTMPSAQPERKKGKWILVRGSNGKDYHKCSECLHTQDITGVKNYCAVCGAVMI